MPLPLLAALAPAAINGITGLISGNQARQDAKHAKSLTDEAVGQARANYADRQKFRDAAAKRLLNPEQLDYSSDYAGLPQYRALNMGPTDEYLTNAAKSLNDSPDRVAQAKQIMQDWDTENAPMLDARFRKVGQRASTLGRLGAGGVTTDLGNIQSDFERNRMLTRNSALRDALDAGQSDKLNRLSAFSRLQDQRYGQQSGERSYADRLAQDAVAGRVSARDRANAQGNTQFNQGMSLGTFGYGGDPTSTLLAGANTYNSSAADNAKGAGDALAGAGSLFQQYLKSRQKSGSQMEPSATAGG